MQGVLLSYSITIKSFFFCCEKQLFTIFVKYFHTKLITHNVIFNESDPINER